MISSRIVDAKGYRHLDFREILKFYSREQRVRTFPVAFQFEHADRSHEVNEPPRVPKSIEQLQKELSIQKRMIRRAKTEEKNNSNTYDAIFDWF